MSSQANLTQTVYGLAQRTAELDFDPTKTFDHYDDLEEEIDDDEEQERPMAAPTNNLAIPSGGDFASEETAFLKVIFQRLDRNNEGRIDRGDIARCLNKFGGQMSYGRGLDTLSHSRDFATQFSNPVIPSSSSSLTSVAFRSKDGQSDAVGTLDFNNFCQMMLESRVRSCCGYVILCFVANILPVLYAANTRLIFIFVALEAVDQRNAELWQVSMVLGCYQTCRAFANAIIGGCGGPEPFRRCYIPMTILALIGWILSLRLPQESVWNLLLLSLVGLSESVVCLQDSLLKETRAEHVSAIVFAAALSQRMRFQYVGVSLGSTVAFIIGGRLYKSYGFNTICWFGVGLSIAQIVIGFIYTMLGATKEDTGDTQPSHTHSNHNPAHVQLKMLAYKVAAAVVLEEETEGKGPTRQRVAQVLPVASRNSHVRVALQELYLSLTRQSGGFGEDEYVELLSMSGGSAVSEDLSRRAIDEIAMQQSGPTPANSGKVIANGLPTTIPTQMRSMKTGLSLLMGTYETKPGFNHVDARSKARASVGMCLMRTHNAKRKLSVHEFVSYMLPRVHLAMHPETMLQKKKVPGYMYWVVSTQAVMALCIGTFLSTSLLYYNQVHQLSSAAVGLCLGIGELLGALSILLVYLMTKRELPKPEVKTGDSERARLVQSKSGSLVELIQQQESEPFASRGCCLATCRILATRPLHVPVILTVLAMASATFALPSVVVSIASQLLLSSINDLSVSLLNELTAVGVPPDKFRKYQSFGQWLRRLGNCLTGFIGPILFNLGAQLPFVFFGCIVFIWTLMLWSVLLAHAREITPGCNAGSFPPITAFRPFIGRRPWHVYESQYYHAKRLDQDHYGTASLAVRDLEYEVAFLRSQVTKLIYKVRVLESKNTATKQPENGKRTETEVPGGGVKMFGMFADELPPDNLLEEPPENTECSIDIVTEVPVDPTSVQLIDDTISPI